MRRRDVADKPPWHNPGCQTWALRVLMLVVGLGCLALVIFAQGNT